MLNAPVFQFSEASRGGRAVQSSSITTATCLGGGFIAGGVVVWALNQQLLLVHCEVFGPHSLVHAGRLCDLHAWLEPSVDMRLGVLTYGSGMKNGASFTPYTTYGAFP